MNYTTLQCVLFDLDGTFLDTSQDMAKALNQLLTENDKEPLPYNSIRPQVSHGARGLLQLGFNLAPEHDEFEPMRTRYLELYEACMFEQTQAFEGIDRVLRECGLRDLKWGIVTNKPKYLTDKILRHLGYWRHASAIIAGDSLPERKPHPAPMFKAAEISGVPANACCYIGDAERDIEAGRNANMRTVCALWGFLGTDDTPDKWQADVSLQHPDDLIALIRQWSAK